MHHLRIQSFAGIVLWVGGPLASVPSAAEMVLMADRVVYSEAAGEAVLQLNQVGTMPGLVQVWLDTGDVTADPATVTVPFVVAPAVARINPGQGQAVRIVRTGGSLPADRESLFWLNVLEVLPDSGASAGMDGNRMRFSFRMRLKVFYRPAGLQPARSEAPGQLRFTLAPPHADGRARVRVSNPTPYWLVLQRLELRHAGDGTAGAALAAVHFAAADISDELVAPQGERLLALEPPPGTERITLPAAVDVACEVFNDQGFTEPLRQRLQQ